MTATAYVLKHRTCGHVGTAASDRAGLERMRRNLATVGYHQWRVQVATDDDLLGLLQNRMCDKCRIDPSRGVLLRDQSGGEP